MAKARAWECGACAYKWPVQVGAVPETAACPRCGAKVEAVAEAIVNAKAEADAARAAEG